MSASTSSKIGSAAVTAGGRSPAWWSSAARPSVFRATVLPPVFGPLRTSARSGPRSRSIGTAVAGSSSGWRAPSSRTSSQTSTGAPRQRRESVPQASGEVDRGSRLDERSRCRRRSPTASESSRRIRTTSSRSAPAASDWRLLSSTTSNGSTNSVWPEPEASWTIPGTLLRELALHREHRPAAALGDEVLLEMLAQARRAREPAKLLGHALPPVAQLRRAACEAAARRCRAGRSRPPRRDGRAPRRAGRASGRSRPRARRGAARAPPARRARPAPGARPRSWARRCSAPRASARRRAPRAQRPRGRRGSRRAAARATRRGARSPPRSAPAAGDLAGLGRGCERPRELGPVRRSPSRRRAARRSRETRGRRELLRPSSECTTGASGGGSG